MLKINRGIKCSHKHFTKIAVSYAGLQRRQEVISFLFLLKKEAGVTHVRQVQVHSKHIVRGRH